MNLNAAIYMRENKNIAIISKEEIRLQISSRFISSMENWIKLS